MIMQRVNKTHNSYVAHTHLLGDGGYTARKSIARYVLFAILAITLAACDNNVTGGTVIGKLYDGDCWELTLQNKAGQTGKICVSSDTWHHLNIGDNFGYQP